METWRREIQEAARKARANPFINMSGIAREVGWAPAQMSNFCDDGDGDEAKVRRLGSILRQLGILGDIDHVIAAQFRAFADFMDSPDASADAKAIGLMEFLNALQGSISAYVSALQKGEDGGLEEVAVESGNAAHG